MNWIVNTISSANKSLESFPERDIERIRATINEMEANPFGGDIVKLGGSDGWRRRVGNYRIKFLIETTSRIVHVYEIERRTSNTYRKKK